MKLGKRTSAPGSLVAYDTIGTSSFSCKCGQKPTTVVLVGCTQHGKSSLIRAIFDYAGLEQDGDNVKIGAYGNSSTTKACTVFEIVVQLRDHFIKDDSGRSRKVDMDKSTSQDVQDLMDVAVEEISNPAGRHVHLRIVDTPGLDDTDNAEAARKKESTGFHAGAVPMRVVDEKHKMTILETIAGVGEVSSVCFVVSSQSPLNFSLQGLLKEYIDIFEMSNLDGAYHFLLTKVAAEQLFDPGVRARPSEVANCLGIHSATHHFMENLLDPNDPVAIYFAHSAMARWLDSISTDAAQSVKELKYPKSAGLKAMDRSLRVALDVDLRYYETKETEAKNKLAAVQSKITRLEARKPVQENNWHDLYRRVEALDTTELIEIESRYGYERSHFFSYSRLNWNISTQHTIRKVVRDPPTPVYSTWDSYNDDAHVGSKRYCNELESDSRNTAISGTVKLFAWKKDVEEDEIRRLTAEKEEAWTEWQDTKDDINKATEEIAGLKSSIESNRELAEACRERKAVLDKSSITIDNIKTKGVYFATCSLVSYAFALGLTQNTIYKFQFPTPYTDASADEAKRRYAAKHDAAAAMLSVCEAMAGCLDKGIESVEESLEALTSCRKRAAAAIADVQKRMAEDVSEWTPQSPPIDEPFSPLSTADAKPRLDMRQLIIDQIKPLLDVAHDEAEEALASHGELLVSRQVVAEAGVEKLRKLKETLMAVRDRWVEKKVDAEASTVACRVLRDKYTVHGQFTTGAFGVMKDAIDEFGAASDEVWAQLFYHVREAYLDGPKRWEEVLATL